MNHFQGLYYFLEQNVILFLEQPKLVIKSFFCEDEYILNTLFSKGKENHHYSIFHKILKVENQTLFVIFVFWPQNLVLDLTHFF